MDEVSVVWKGMDGTAYHYKAYGPQTVWNDVPGCYIFAKLDPTGWYALYIGETSSLRDRVTPVHEKWLGASRLGMTHIHAHVSPPDQKVRRMEERNLIEQYRPPLNSGGLPFS